MSFSKWNCDIDGEIATFPLRSKFTEVSGRCLQNQSSRIDLYPCFFNIENSSYPLFQDTYKLCNILFTSLLPCLTISPI